VRFFSSYPPHELVGLPSLSPTMESGSIAAWNLKEGESFIAGDIFCSVETDKATVDFEAQDDGVLAKILAQAGPDEIKCGDPIMITIEDEAHLGAFADYTLDSGTESSPPAPDAAPTSTASSPSPKSLPAENKGTPDVTTSATSPDTGDRIVASPLAHMLAKEMGYNISKIPGTGPNGRIIAADVKEYTPGAVEDADTVDTPAPAQAAMKSSPAQPVSGSGYTDYPLSESAREVAARLAQAKRNVPHYYLTVDIAVDELLKIRSTLNATLDESAALGVYELLLKAAALSMKAVPSANASWMDSVVRVYDSVDINVVVGSGDSLVTPVIQNCSSKGLKAISEELGSAVKALEEDDDAPIGGLGTFTVMNLGMYGVKSCAPIIREPQACALAIGALETRIVPNDDPDAEDIYKESVMFTATLSCDHRVVDGAVGAQWLQAFKSHVQNPTTLLL
jgi:pyruvate dehydrogenase E2 component (dihydrolipoamide acetyltransferase)